MRPLTDEEYQNMFEKLSKYIGKNIEQLLTREDDLMLKAATFARDNLLSMGIKLGKFNKNKKFRLHITALDVISPLAQYKVWVKSSSEMGFLYGNHIPKMGLSRMTESIPQYSGVIVYNMANLPLGFGLAAQTTDNCRSLDPNGLVVLHQADIGEYLRDENILV